MLKLAVAATPVNAPPVDFAVSVPTDRTATGVGVTDTVIEEALGAMFTVAGTESAVTLLDNETCAPVESDARPSSVTVIVAAVPPMI